MLAALAPAGDWRSYVNARYAYSICYPRQFVPQGEADNGDGQVFAGPGGAELRVYGSNNVLDRSLAEEMADQARLLTGRNGKVTYRFANKGSAVVSGDDGAGTVFYAKTIARSDQFLSFQLRYPKAASARYKPVVETIARCFRPLKR